MKPKSGPRNKKIQGKVRKKKTLGRSDDNKGKKKISDMTVDDMFSMVQDDDVVSMV